MSAGRPHPFRVTGRRRPWLAALPAAVLLGSASTPAAAAPATTALNPAEVLWFETPARAGDSCELDRSAWLESAAPEGQKMAYRSIMYAGMDREARVPVAAACDPERWRAGRPGAGISAVLSGRRLANAAVDLGYSAIEAPLLSDGGTGGGLRPGDVLQLPETGTEGGVAVWVRAGAGVRRVLLPAGPEARVRVEADDAAGRPRVVLTRGSAAQVFPVEAVDPRPVRVDAVVRGRRVHVRFRGLARGAVAGVFGEDDAIGRRSRGSRIRISLGVSELDSGGLFVAWSDPATRRGGLFGCSRRNTRSRRVVCRGGEAGRSGQAARAQMSGPYGNSTPMVPAAPQAPVAQRASTIAPRDRFVMRAVRLDVSAMSDVVGDIDGDGHAELLSPSRRSLDMALVASAADGGLGRRTPLDVGFAAPAGDLDGDGHGDLLTQGGVVRFGARASGALTFATDGPMVLNAFASPSLIFQGPSSVALIPNGAGGSRSAIGIKVDDDVLVVASPPVLRSARLDVPRVSRDATRGTARTLPVTLDTAGVHVLRIVTQSTRRRPVGSVRLETRGALGPTTRRGPVLRVRGRVLSMQRDAASGESLLETLEERRSTERRWFARLGSDGQLLARFSVREGDAATLGPDGPDADLVPEVYVSGRSSLRVLPSGFRGAADPRAFATATDSTGTPLPAVLPPWPETGPASGSLTVRGLYGRYGDGWSRLLPD